MSFISPVATDTNGNPRNTGSLQSLGKDDFLQLLVTKLQHQDPLKPMDDEDFIAQLAQFSTLEQMYNISEGINTSNQWDFLQMQSLNNVMASGLIGREVTAEYNGVYLDATNEPAVAYTLDEFAKNLTFVVRNADGEEIASITQDNVEAGSGSVVWDGLDHEGNRVEDGYYTIEVTATSSTGESFTPSLSLVGLVTAITYREGAAYLTVNGTEISLGDIKTIAEPAVSETVPEEETEG